VSRDREDTIEGAEEEEGPSIVTSDEMEAALREAEEAVEEVHKQAAADSDAHSPDKLTIELLSGELQSLKDEFEGRGKELEEAAERQVRLQAEFENFRRRNLKERQESLRYGHQNLVKDLLTSVDNLDRAIEHSEQNDDADFQSLLQGIDLVRRDLLAALGKHGVSVVEAAQQPFDPTYHEAMGQVPDGNVPPNTVVAVLQTGYLLHDRMLRPARVMVSRAPTEEEAQAAKKST
jgi:molecular chaperone GrpE